MFAFLMTMMFIDRARNAEKAFPVSIDDLLEDLPEEALADEGLLDWTLIDADF